MEVMWKIDQFDAQSLSRMAGAFAALGYCKEPMFDWLAARVVGRISDYGPEELAVVAAAFAQLGLRSAFQVLQEAIESQVIEKRAGFDDTELSRIIWAFGKIDASSRGLSQPLYQRFDQG